MKLRQAITPIAIVSTLGLLTAGEAAAVSAAKGLSYMNVENIVFFPDGGDGNASDGVFDCLPGIDPDCFVTVSPDVPVSSSSASKAGEPDAGSTAVNPALERGPLNVDQACVRDFPPVEDDPAFTPPCQANDTFSDVPGFPTNNVSRGDARIDAVLGYAFPGADCPADGLGTCGDPGNTDGPDARSIAESQVNVVGEQGKAESDGADTANGIFLANGGESAVTVIFNVDWCRQAQLEDAVSSATTTSKATGSSNANFVLSIAAGQPGAGTVVFDANLQGESPGLTSMNGTTELVAPVPGPVTDLVSSDALGTPGNPPCFPRPGGSVPVVISTNPDGLTKAACDAARPSCFISDPDVEYTFNISEGTDVDVLVFAPGDGVYKWWFGKQIAPFDDDNPELEEPINVAVNLKDQFDDRNYSVRSLRGLQTPAGKDESVDPDREGHLSCWGISDLPFQGLAPNNEVDFITANFGADTISQLRTARELCVTASKEFPKDSGNVEFDPTLSSYKCYDVGFGTVINEDHFLDDQFDFDETDPRTIRRLSRFCVPVTVDGGAPPVIVEDPNVPETWQHLACYELPVKSLFPNFLKAEVADQFILDQVGQDIDFTVERELRMCEPAIKTAVDGVPLIP